MRTAVGDAVGRDAIGPRALLSPALVLLAMGSQAAAGGFYSPYQSITAIGTAFAGATARTDDAGFFFYNPAAVAGIDARQTYVDIRAFAPDVAIVPTQAVSPLGVSATGDGASGGIAGSAFAAGGVTVLPLGPGLNLAVGSSAPFATDVETAPGWAGRYHLQRSTMVGLNATAALSWQAASWLAVAVGVQGQWMTNSFRNLAVVPQGLAPPVEARAWLDATGWAAGAVAGLMVTPWQGTRLGVSWRSALTHSMTGRTSADAAGVPVEHVRYDVDLPQSVSVGLEQRIGRDLRLLAEWQWVDWSRFGGFEFTFASGRPTERRPIAWRDTWLAAVGLGYRILPTVEVTAGVSFDRGASPDGSGSTLSPDADKTLLGLGLVWDIDGGRHLSVSYGHLMLSDAPVRAASLASGVLEGRLHGHMDMVGLGYTVLW